MNRAVLTGWPLRVTSVTSTTPRALTISTRRPAREASISYVRDPSSADTTISTRSPLTGRAYRGGRVPFEGPERHAALLRGAALARGGGRRRQPAGRGRGGAPPCAGSPGPA